MNGARNAATRIITIQTNIFINALPFLFLPKPPCGVCAISLMGSRAPQRIVSASPDEESTVFRLNDV